MQKIMDDSVICAIATPPGRGAIAVARVSGRGAIDVCERVIRLRRGKRLSECPSRTLLMGELVDGDRRVDEVVVALFRAPRSFTGEDGAEISCHGSTYIQQRALELLVGAGARLATPGEFTLRAFLNGKMDLPRAEAVMDVASATSAAAHEMAMKQARGEVSRELKRVRAEMLEMAALVELELDFAEEDATFAGRDAITAIALRAREAIGKLRDSFSLGNALKHGVPAAIVGPPNAGKSTLLNTLAREERAIVSPREGTTRDSIEEVMNIGGVEFRFIDTAGIRDATDEIEAEGIARTFATISRSRAVLLLVDASRLSSFPDTYRQVRARLAPGATLAVLLNKIDVAERPESLLDHLRALSSGEPLLPVSARTGEGLERLEQLLLSATTDDGASPALVSNARHHEALARALEALDRLLAGLESGLSEEFLSRDIRDCLHYVGEITGEITTDEILGNIFKNFCIGK
jgi:tRNA modification GTPase